MPQILTSSVLLISLALGGCVIAPGNNGRDWDDDRDPVRPTIGQELLDLDRARDAGVISTDEYERTKARILDEN
jgi:hypothetical protein